MVDNSDPLNPFLAWGTPGGSGTDFNPVRFRSGFEVQVASDPVPNPASPVPGQFDFGTFTHFNNPIAAGTGLTSVDLTVTADVVLDGITTILSGASFLFNFALDETANACSPQPSCADDTVTTSVLNGTSTVNVGGVDYTLSFLGFVQNGVLNSQFVSPEGTANTGTLRAEFTSAIPGTIPLPAGLPLLLTGLGGLAWLRRRKAMQGRSPVRTLGFGRALCPPFSYRPGLRTLTVRVKSRSAPSAHSSRCCARPPVRITGAEPASGVLITACFVSDFAGHGVADLNNFFLLGAGGEGNEKGENGKASGHGAPVRHASFGSG
ncbi:choice-of-anchor K domain-containing protein [Roseovarius aestuariivivens]|uniref:choice-of-anchor K domain-containing protein n=1 Tax=Roseovarius aestuariivivens TaxID=1888910 RepID=UPI001AEC60E4|nr:choice-of-anchor K domain-containing protein [Roseovarius aestuariivivens]